MACRTAPLTRGGRFWEISDPTVEYINRPTLSTGNAGDWWAYTSDGYSRGNTPQLRGGNMFWRATETRGHVAIVEEILSNGDVVTSNSARHGQYFYMRTYEANTGYNWSDYVFQGFIYNPYVTPTPPPTPTSARSRFPWVLYARKFRQNRQNNNFML